MSKAKYRYLIIEVEQTSDSQKIPSVRVRFPSDVDLLDGVCVSASAFGNNIIHDKKVAGTLSLQINNKKEHPIHLPIIINDARSITRRLDYLDIGSEIIPNSNAFGYINLLGFVASKIKIYLKCRVKAS